MAIVNFIMSNYIAIIIVVMIVIFALIGRYVEKSGLLAQAQDKNKEAKKQVEVKIEEPVKQETITPQPEEIKKEQTADSNISIEDIDKALFAPIDDNKEYAQFNNEVKELLPKKDIMDDSLLSDINNLSLDKTQKYNFGDIPDLDDVDLPKIKKADEEEDIWKF